MRKIIVSISLLFVSASLSAQEYQRTAQGISATVNGIAIDVAFFEPGTVRIVKIPKGKQVDKQSLSVIAKPTAVKYSVSKKKSLLTLKSEQLEVFLDLSSGKLSFSDLQGNVLLKENANAVFTDFDDAGTATYRAKQSFKLDPDEPIYGLGILQNGKMSQRNENRHMVQGNVEDVVPFFQSVKGYGLYWDNYSPTNFADSKEETSFESEVADLVDYYFVYGKDADGVVAKMRNLTGQVPMFPLWTYGFWQSRERYKSQQELVEVVDKYRELGVPLDGIVQDWQYWGNNYLWNSMEFLNSEFPNPTQMIDHVHDQHAKIIVSIWSSFGPQTKPYRQLDEKGLLFNIKTWPESGVEFWPPNLEYPSGVRVYDAYSPIARDIYWNNLKGLFDLDIDGWWMDSTEPDHMQFKPEDMDTKTYLGSFRRVRNAYPLMTVGGVYDHQRKESSDKRVFILTRSGFAGQQRYGANVWSGDTGSSWDTFRKQIPAGLNFTLTGNPNYNADIGGFFAGAYNKSWNDGSATQNPLFQELYVRWMQQGAFTPMMRSHGTEIKREIYYFGQKGEPIYDAIEKAIDLRYSLLPYIYSTSWEVTSQQGSFMRALVMDFPKDKNVWDINDQYMFGTSILVAPVVHAQYTPEKIVKVNEESGWNKNNDKDKNGKLAVNFKAKKSSTVYLPAGTVWYDFWTNERLDGGQEINRETTIDLIPLYIKAGTILPIGPEVQYATEKKWDNLELRVYEGADGNFTLYEDEFDNYNYEKGAYSEIPMQWNNRSKVLTINARKGNFAGMLQDRRFTVKLENGESKTIEYKGDIVKVSF